MLWVFSGLPRLLASVHLVPQLLSRSFLYCNIVLFPRLVITFGCVHMRASRPLVTWRSVRLFTDPTTQRVVLQPKLSSCGDRRRGAQGLSKSIALNQDQRRVQCCVSKEGWRPEPVWTRKCLKLLFLMAVLGSDSLLKSRLWTPE